jgi:uncharacterized protein YcfJ
MAGMRKSITVTALASLLALPLLIGAGEANAASCGTRKLNGTLLGAAGGAVLGGAVTHGSTGPIVGGLAGAVAGREIGRSGCSSRSYHSSRARPVYRRSAPARYQAPPRETVRKVYYDQYGTPIAQEYYR